MQRNSLVAAVAAALALGCLSGCGGGVAIGTDPGRTLAVADPSADRTVTAVSLFDAVAGVERMLAASNGYSVIEGPSGVDVTSACAGGGTIRVRKVTATTADLSPADCRLRTDDTLVYAGTWRFAVTSSSFGATGACPAGTVCQLSATIDLSTARYGYGSATERVVGTQYQSVTDAAGFRRALVRAGGETLPSLDATVLAGTLDNLVMRLPGAVDWQIIGDVTRQTLQVASPFGATLVLGPSISATFDDNRDGVTDRTATVPWSAFLP
jgi:hypothetical protein